MMGFGSDSYQGYMGANGGGSSGGTIYNPPGGKSNSSDSSINNSGNASKWGSGSQYKPMGTHYSEIAKKEDEKVKTKELVAPLAEPKKTSGHKKK